MLLAFLAGLIMATGSSHILTVPAEMMVVPIDPKEVWIDKLIACESGGNEKIKVLDTNGYYSHGLVQFQMKTWLSFGKKFGTTKKNIYDGELQKKVVRAMLDDGGWKHWYQCSKIIGDEYPADTLSPFQ